MMLICRVCRIGSMCRHEGIGYSAPTAHVPLACHRAIFCITWLLHEC